MNVELIALLALAVGMEAQDLSHLPAYQLEKKVAGVIRLWGHGSPKHDFMGSLLTAWKTGFARYQPDVSFENRMYGTASSIGALYTGVGDLAIRGEEIHPFEIAAFERVMHHPPAAVEVATGSLDVRNMDFAFVVFVHRDNPLAQLTLAQLDAVLGFEHRRSSRNIRTWGELGVTGDFADKPINIHSWRLDDDFSSFLQEAVLNGSHKWNCAIKEYAHITRSDGAIYDSGQQILDALGADRYGLGISSVRYKNPQVKPLALAWQNGGAYYQATKETLIARQYPLTRFIPAFYNREPGKPLEPKVREFLRYILSREGQQAVLQTGGYLPMSAEAVREQLQKLN
jgi:phosphate transport system substrate-binding protein